MANFRMENIKKELKDVMEQGITFEDKMQKWNTAEDAKGLVTALENTKVVNYLKLDGNTLGVPAAEAIGKALEKHPELRKALWKNMFTGRLLTEIPQALKVLGNGLMVAKAQLTVLDLSDNALGPNGMLGLEDLLRSPVCYSLQELLLNNCGLGIEGGRMLSKALVDCHRNSTEAGTPLKLKVFITGRNRLENDGAKAIANIFSTIKTLEMISMPQNSIYHDGMNALAQGIRENPNLRVLNLNDNTMRSKGALAIAEALAYTPKLREINLGDCLLKTNGAYHIAEALEKNHDELEVVDLGFNEIGADGGIVLATAMEKKTKLKRLNLDGNQFGADGRERIRDEMKKSCNPRALDDMDEDQSDCEEEDDDEDDEEDEDDVDDETIDEEEDIYERGNDTTEEVEEEEDYQDYGEDAAEETAYMTTQTFSAKMLNPNELSFANKSVTFASTDKTARTEPTAENFCLSQQPCSLEMFENLPDKDKLEAFRGIINQFSDDNYLLVLVFTTLKCAHLAQSSADALQISIALFKDIIEYAVKTKQERRVLNYLLKQLGLLRSEEKFKSTYDLNSCRFALRETLLKDKVGSEHMKNTFNVFLDNHDLAI